MKFLPIALVLGSVFIEQTLAHYRFYKVIKDGVSTDEYKYVRQNTNNNSPVTDVTSEDLRCNVGGLASASSTSTLSVAAGDTIGFESDIAVFHPGPFNVYMAKAPSTAASFDGSGDVWFRIWEKGPSSLTSSSIDFDITDSKFNFTIPASLPTSEYLVRIEHIALHSASSFGGAQFYISCAQISVTGGGSGNPSPKVAIPGVYTGNESGILLSIYYPIPTNYTVPGPALWTA